MQPGSLCAASFWIALRQEIYIAVMHRQKVGMNLSHSLVDRSWDSADDYGWANRAIVHCAEVLNFWYEYYHDRNTNQDHRVRFQELWEWNLKWERSLPPSFQSTAEIKRDDITFPEIWYHRSCHGKQSPC